MFSYIWHLHFPLQEMYLHYIFNLKENSEEVAAGGGFSCAYFISLVYMFVLFAPDQTVNETGCCR